MGMWGCGDVGVRVVWGGHVYHILPFIFILVLTSSAGSRMCMVNSLPLQTAKLISHFL